MDPNPQTFPILSYVMSKFPSIGAGRNHGNESEFDIEQQPLPPASPEKPYFELTEQMPHLNDPKVVAEMRQAVVEVAQTRSVLKTLGVRPDHEFVDSAKAKLAEIDANVALDDAAKEIEKQAYKAVISLDELHEAYARMLDEAEDRLQKIYKKVVERAGESTDDENQSSAVVEEVNEEVVEILREASGKQVERIDLSERQLRYLPETFGRLETLQALILSSNQLQVVPDSIGQLKKLEELQLASNVLESLPDSIGLLQNLKKLNVSGNKLVALPDSMCYCRSLVELDLSFNKLTYLPTNIGYELVNLVRLSIAFNKLRSLPSSIGEMKSLRQIDAHFNELNGLPLSIGRLANLESLNLSSNFSDLTALPDTIGDLITLKELDISNNQIHALPDTFGLLETLAKLNVNENPLVIPPKEVVNEGVEAIKSFMAKRWSEIVEEERSIHEVKQQTDSSVLTRSTSWLNNMVSTVTGTISGYMGSPRKPDVDPYLNQQL